MIKHKWILLLGIGMLGIAKSSFSAVVLDQEFDYNYQFMAIGQQIDYNNVNGGEPYPNQEAQTFTVGIAGVLDSVAVQIYKSYGINNTSGDLSVSILPTSGGVPLNDISAALATAKLSPVNIPVSGDRGFVSADFSDANISVSIGDVLAIMLWAPTLQYNDYYYWSISSYGTGYVQGESYSKMDTTTWASNDIYGTHWDRGFRTYVNTVPIPGAIWLFGSALIGLVGLKRKPAQPQGVMK